LESIPTDPLRPVHTALDLGFRDDCAGWMWQRTPAGVDYVRAFSISGYAVPDIHSLLLENGHTGDLYLPHDAMARSMQTGRSVMEQFVSMGHRPRLVGRLTVQDGIQAVRQHISDKGVRFSLEGCREGIEAIRQYQREWNEQTGAFSQAPKHDWTSHYADALRYAALSIRPPKAAAPATTIKAVPRVVEIPKLTLEGLWESNKRTPTYERV
jgi:phage terminase large subunit